MEDPIHWYHVVTALGVPVTAILAIWWRVDAMFIKPTKEWRKTTEEEHQELKHDYELFKQRVENDLQRGDAAFEKLESKIDKLDETMRMMTQEMIRLRSSLENGMRNAVITGMGDASSK